MANLQAGLRILAITATAFLIATPASARTVEMRVGQTERITSYRAERCGAPAPSFDQIKNRLPRSGLVQYVDGGLSSRRSDVCKTVVPVRVINGKAIKAGKETKRYQAGTATIIVK